MKSEIIIQIFTGGYQKQEATYEQIEAKLRPILEQIPVTAVLIGWSVDQELYRKTLELVHQYQTELYLWLPVLSEVGLLRPASLLRDCEGKEVKSYQLKESENFEFYCPGEAVNRNNVIDIYETYFSDIGFDGVFLDKIRYGSFANGLSGVFSCFCSACMKRYQERGLDTRGLMGEMHKLMQGMEEYQHTPLNITAYQNGTYQFQEPVWEQFFELKADFIHEALQEITTYFRAKKMKIGMDVLSPFLGYFVGQDYRRLKELTDFMKPMMYRVTAAPAGLPFEYESILTATIKEHRNGDQRAAGIRFEDILGISKGMRGRFDLDFVKAELAYLEALDIPIYCGIEVNKIDEIAPVTPEYIKENINQLEAVNINGFVLSWDILSAPDTNIEAVYDALKE